MAYDLSQGSNGLSILTLPTLGATWLERELASRNRTPFVAQGSVARSRMPWTGAGRALSVRDMPTVCRMDEYRGFKGSGRNSGARQITPGSVRPMIIAPRGLDGLVSLGRLCQRLCRSFTQPVKGRSLLFVKN
jgi:hypothetical protein